MLKMIYFRLDNGSQLGGMIARPFQNLVSFIYEHTQFLNIFWKISPTPNHLQLSEIGNIYFIGIYLMVFVGAAFYSAGVKLSRRLDGIKEKIENQVLEESIKGEKARSREEIENSTEIPTSSVFSQIHQLYLAPVITGIIGAVLLKILGL